MKINKALLMKQYKPLPANLELAPTLAQRVFQLRHLRNLSTQDLAKLSQLTADRIQDIEAGLESWLSTIDRQLLAKALAIEPSLLQEVEMRVGKEDLQAINLLKIQLENLVLKGAKDLECPQCGSILKCSIQNACDLEGNAMQLAKAFCLQCPFVLH